MRIRYHPQVQRDLDEALRHYASISGDLADRFWEEFESVIAQIETAPMHCHFDTTGLRRSNFKRFPYHVLFRILGDRIKIIVVRHHRRRSTYGTQRM